MNSKIHGCRRRIKYCSNRIENYKNNIKNAPTAFGRQICEEGLQRELKLLDKLHMELFYLERQ